MQYTIKITVFLTIIAFLVACKDTASDKQETLNTSTEKIKVGVFNKNGDSPYCITDAVEAVTIDSAIDARIVSAADIMNGNANDIDVFIFPGGSGRSETGSLGEQGQARIQQLVREQGKGVIGICAGAYILSNTPDYPSLWLSGAKAIDIEHDHRGHGLVKFSLTEAGKAIFPELKNQDILFCQYYEGPVLEANEDSTTTFTELATMLSDVHLVEGTPANMTNNRPFIILSQAGKGKTASIVGHPESTPGMRWMVPRLVRVVLNKPFINYNALVVRPHIYTHEYLYTAKRLAQQRADYYALTKSVDQKKKAMQNIVNHYAWSAKKWIPPMLRDNDYNVRLLAAKLTVHLERTDAIPDLQAAVDNEKNSKQKALLQKQLDKLRSIKAL